MSRIFAFHGPAGAGKDECGKYLIESHGFTRISFATPIYKALEAMGFGWPKTQEEKEALVPELGVSWRHMAQTLGTEWGRNMVHPDMWIILAKKYMTDNPGARFVMTDVRFENEADMVRKLGGRIVHLVGRKAEITSNQQHASEQPLRRGEDDVVLHNDIAGIAVLHEKIEIALRSWL
jgi:hypothetical protein